MAKYEMKLSREILNFITVNNLQLLSLVDDLDRQSENKSFLRVLTEIK